MELTSRPRQALRWPVAWGVWCCAIRMAWWCTCTRQLEARGCN